jgi:PAS domain S-box-containing protein
MLQIALILSVLLAVFLLAERIASSRAKRSTLDVLSMAAGTGDEFFRALVVHLRHRFGADYVGLAELSPSGTQLRTVAVVADGRMVDPFDYELANTPCERAMASSRYSVADVVQSNFHLDPVMQRLGLRSYLGVALTDSAGGALGVLALMARGCLRQRRPDMAVLEVLGRRAAAEMQRRRAGLAFQASEAKTRAMLQALPDFMFVQDRLGTYLDYYAPSAERLYVSADQFLGKRFQDVLPPEVVTAIEPAFMKVVATGESAAVEYQLTIGGAAQFFEARMVHLAPDNVLSIVRDLTDKRRAENALEASRHFAERLAQTIPNVIFLYDLTERRNVYVNNRSESVLGYTAHEVIAMGDQFLARTMHPDDLKTLPRLVERYARARDGDILEHLFRFRHKNGEWRWVSRRATVFARAADGRPTQMLGSATDVTALKTAEDELRSLSARLRNSQDDERRRIATELHDGVAQSLFGVTAFLASLRQRNDLPRDLSDVLAECERYCDAGLKEVRLLSYVLHPPMLDEIGLAPALKWFTDGLERRSGIDVDLEVEEPMERLPLTVEHDLFRIVQEGLSNVIRHSGSVKVVVRLGRQQDGAVLQIQDFGRGMPKAFESSDFGSPIAGVGILSMRERLRHIGGRLEIQSSPQGTTLTATVPVGLDPMIS